MVVVLPIKKSMITYWKMICTHWCPQILNQIGYQSVSIAKTHHYLTIDDAHISKRHIQKAISEMPVYYNNIECTTTKAYKLYILRLIPDPMHTGFKVIWA